MNPRVLQTLEQLRGPWRFRWAAISTAAAAALAGWLLVFALPDQYQATAEVLVDTRTALAGQLAGLTVAQDVGVQLAYVRESLLAEPQLLKTAQQAGVFPANEIGEVRKEDLLANFGKRIGLTVQSSDEQGGGSTHGATYQIIYRDVDRARALRVVSILLDTLVNETLGGKRQSSNSAQQFLQTQVEDYEKRLRTAEDRLAAFKSRHLGLMPSEQGGYFTELQKETDAVETLKTKLLTAESRRTTLEAQLHGDAAVAAALAAAPVLNNKGTSAGVDTASRIAETQARLDELRLKFTEKHPDVISTEETLADLKRRREAELENLRHGDASAVSASGASANPVFQSIQLALNQADVEIADVRTQLAQHESKAKQLRDLLGTAPQVEAEYAQLARDYDVNKAQYTALLSNLEKARLGERADEAGSVRFQVVQPPFAGLRPVSPRRVFLLTGVLFGALALGGALSYRLDRLHPVITSAASLAAVAGVAVLGVVGVAFPTRAWRKSRRDLWRVSAAVACLVAAFGVAVYLSRHGVRLNVSSIRHLVQT